jgi:hypothetical protein
MRWRSSTTSSWACDERRAARPFHHDAVDPRGRRRGRHLRSATTPGAGGSLPDVLAAALCLPAPARPHAGRRTGSDARVFARILERQDFRAADPTRGKFRSFLLTALQHYAINEHDRAKATKRGGELQRSSLDFGEAERTYALEARSDDSPDRVFNRKWAAISLDRALQRLRDECRAAGKGTLADTLVPYLTDTGNLPTYRTVAEQLGLTEGATKVAVHRLRRRFGAILRLEIADTVLTPADVDDEVRELIRALSPS